MPTHTSSSTYHDMLRGGVLGSVQTPQTSPDFYLTPAPFSPPEGDTVTYSIQYSNDSSDGFTNVAVELSDLGTLQVVSANPTTVGTIGAASTGFANFQVIANQPEQITATLTGDILGVPYIHVVNPTITPVEG